MTFHNLGSLQRKLGIIIEEFQRSRNTWEEINSHSFSKANALTNTVIQSRYVDESKYWHPLLKLEFPDIMQKYDSKMNQLIEKQSLILLDLVEKLEKQFNKMNQQHKDIVTQYEQLIKMYGIEVVNKQPIYQTCPLTKYMDRMKDIIEMYNKELNTKRKTLEGMKNLSTREEGVVLLSVWIHQPNLIKSKIEEWEDLCKVEMNIYELK